MNQIIMILLISILVLVHEAGHFIAARLCGVRVTRFGIGMPIGPSWKLFRWKNTDFYLHAFLFGGYVSFPDDNSQNLDDLEQEIIVPEKKENETFFEKLKRIHKEKQAQKNKEEIEILKKELLPSDSDELYENKTIGQKFFIVSAGVIMNVIFAVVLVILCAIFYQKLPTQSQNIYVDGFASKITSNISNFDIQKGDKFLKINDTAVNSLYKLVFFAKNSKLFDNYAQQDLIEKNFKALRALNPQINENIKAQTTIILPESYPENPLKVNKNVLDGLEKYKKDGVELNKAQIELRNEIYNKKIYTSKNDITLKDIAIALSDTYKPLSITFLRNDKEYTIQNIKINKEGMLGVLLKTEDIFTPTKTPRDIVMKSFDYLYSTTATMLFSLWQLITGKVSASDMHGVIAIVKVGGDIIASKGMLNGILLTAMISLNLAIMNFLPIPALDGGHVLFLAIEKITGKKPGKDLSEKINNIFFILLIILMLCICYNDILALVTKKF